MTDLEPAADLPDEQLDGQAASDAPVRSFTSSHRRPFPSPAAKVPLLINPEKLSGIQTHSLGEPQTQSSAEQDSTVPAKGGLPSERISFPVAVPPPRARAAKPEAEKPVKTEVALAEKSSNVSSRGEKLSEDTTRRSPLFGLIFYFALALGTLPLNSEVRYLMLWIVLLVLGVGLLDLDGERSSSAILEPVNLMWGAGTGFVLSFPLLLLVTKGLAQTSRALVPFGSNAAMFQAMVLTWPLGESLYYRGAVQREHGLVIAALTAGVGNLLLYWPASQGIFSVLFVAVTFATVLAFIYGYVRMRYGLIAAYVCQVVTNLMLIFLPRILIAG